MARTLQELSNIMTLRELADLCEEHCPEYCTGMSPSTLQRWIKSEENGAKIPSRMRLLLSRLDEPKVNVTIAEWPSTDILPSVLATMPRGTKPSILEGFYNTNFKILRFSSENEACDSVRDGLADVVLANGYRENPGLIGLSEVRRYPSLWLLANEDLPNPKGIVQYIKALNYVLNNFARYNEQVKILSADKDAFTRFSCSKKDFRGEYKYSVNPVTEAHRFRLNMELGVIFRLLYRNEGSSLRKEKELVLDYSI